MHVRREESACPHCGALAPRRRVSLAAPLLVGVALTGCPADEGDADDTSSTGDFGENSAYGVPDTGSFDSSGPPPESESDGSTTTSTGSTTAEETGVTTTTGTDPGSGSSTDTDTDTDTDPGSTRLDHHRLGGSP